MNAAWGVAGRRGIGTPRRGGSCGWGRGEQPDEHSEEQEATTRQTHGRRVAPLSRKAALLLELLLHHDGGGVDADLAQKLVPGVREAMRGASGNDDDLARVGLHGLAAD